MSEILTPQNGEEPSDGRPALVLDTNTVLALWMFRDPTLIALREWIEAGNCRLYSRIDALDELRSVLRYEHFRVSQGQQNEIFAAYVSRLSSPPASLPLASQGEALNLPKCKDKDDQKFLEITALSRAQALLTRDKALLRLAQHRRIRTRFAITPPDRFFAPPRMA